MLIRSRTMRAMLAEVVYCGGLTTSAGFFRIVSVGHSWNCFSSVLRFKEETQKSMCRKNKFWASSLFGAKGELA